MLQRRIAKTQVASPKASNRKVLLLKAGISQEINLPASRAASFDCGEKSRKKPRPNLGLGFFGFSIEHLTSF